MFLLSWTQYIWYYSPCSTLAMSNMHSLNFKFESSMNYVPWKGEIHFPITEILIQCNVGPPALVAAFSIAETFHLMITGDFFLSFWSIFFLSTNILENFGRIFSGSYSISFGGHELSAQKSGCYPGKLPLAKYREISWVQVQVKSCTGQTPQLFTETS